MRCDLMASPSRSASFFFKSYGDHRDLHSFPTRRSSDQQVVVADLPAGEQLHVVACEDDHPEDRKSTRLNSSHEWISYADFCLKKQKQGRVITLYNTIRKKPPGRIPVGMGG